MGYLIYKHISPNNKVYIGITCQEANRRWQNGHGYKKNQYFYNAIQKYGWDNFQHIIVARGLTKDEAEWLEIELIKAYDSTNHNCGYNIDLGGNSLGKCSDEHKQKISEALKQNHADVNGEKNPMYGRYKEMNPFYGKHHSEDAKLRISEANKNNRCGKNNPGAKSVICLTTKKMFYTAKDAADYYGLKRGNISTCCKGKAKSAGKYNGQKLVWRYLKISHNKTLRGSDIGKLHKGCMGYENE